MIGHVLGGRYEIVSRIGGGGMALVYKSKDMLLNRFVAVKILRQQFVHDEEFIFRFRREAQSAASLSHPNVVSIYDVGQEQDIHYIIMEYIEGYNLNEIIRRQAPLQIEQAVKIAIQICDALDHAHQNHIIHRDIKPHNILIGKNGRIKVTDFGIARAATSSTITQTGSVIGSVHYFSPEHAKGLSTEAKSDLYSLGIVLYEMLTATLPFSGESPISVALKHLQENFEEPRKINPHIPQSVENVILRALRKNPNERYQSAKEMLRDLDTALSPQRVQESKVEFREINYDDEQPTRVMPAVGLAQNTNWLDEKTDLISEKKSWKKPALWISITFVFLGAMLTLVMYAKNFVATKEITLPNFVNMSEAQALAKIEELGLNLEQPIVREEKDGIAKGYVFAQNKEAGLKVKEGALIQLSVSEGDEKFTMPELIGKTPTEAKNELRKLKIPDQQITIKEDYSEKEETGHVFSQSPESDSKVSIKETTVVLKVSKGKETVSMPNLIGMKESEAAALLQSNDLTLEKNGIKKDTSYQPIGKIFKQEPYQPGEPAPRQAPITLYVSTGYPPESFVYRFSMSISPNEIGKESTVRLEILDARGDKIDGGQRKISDVQDIEVELVLAPNKDGAVMLYRDGKYVDTFPVKYADAKDGTYQPPKSSSEQEAPPQEENNFQGENEQ